MKKYFVKLMSWLLYSTIHQVMWYFWVFTVDPFSLSLIIFFPRTLCFLWCPCVLLIAESISLDTSGKSKITSSSWIILPISLAELNSTVDCWRGDDEFSWSSFLFYCFKRILIWQTILELFWRIYLNIIFWILLWM